MYHPELGTRPACLHRQQDIKSWVPGQHTCTDSKTTRVGYHASTLADSKTRVGYQDSMLAQTARDSELGTRTVCLHRQQGIQSRYQDSMLAQTARHPE